VPFAAQQPALAANPGKPLDEATLATVKPAAPVPAVPVKLVGPSRSRDAGDKSQAGPPAIPQVQPTPVPSAEQRKGQSELRKQRGQIAEPKTTAPPGIEKPAEPVPASPTVVEPDRTPAARPPVDREIMGAPPPQTGRPDRRQPPSKVKPAEPAPAPPTVVEPNRTPAVSPPPNRGIKEAPPPQTSTDGAVPNPETVKSEAQKTKEQLKREEELKRREMEDKNPNQ